MITHVRIENTSLLVNGFTIGKYNDVMSLASEVEAAIPEDWPLIQALLQVAGDHVSFEHDHYIESDIPRQRAVQALLQASRTIN